MYWPKNERYNKITMCNFFNRINIISHDELQGQEIPLLVVAFCTWSQIMNIKGPTLELPRTGQSISPLGKVPIGFLPEKHHITWVLAVLLFTAKFQMEPLAPNAISYDTKPATYQTNYWLVQI